MLKFEYYADAKGEWRWRLVASNGKVVADGAEGYASRSNVLRACTRLKSHFRYNISLREVAA